MCNFFGINWQDLAFRNFVSSSVKIATLGFDYIGNLQLRSFKTV